MVPKRRETHPDEPKWCAYHKEMAHLKQECPNLLKKGKKESDYGR